jgi:tetratricopeptide (TPR) repeat protein
LLIFHRRLNSRCKVMDMDDEKKDTVSWEEYLALKRALEDKESLIVLQSEALEILREKTGGRRESGGGFPALELGRPLELIVLAVRRTNARCRLPGSDWSLTLRPRGRHFIVPGELINVIPDKQWTFRGYPYLTAGVESGRIDVEALGLEPLGLKEWGTWDPADEYWGEEDEPLEDWAAEIIARGPRPAYEMEKVIPGEDPEDFDSDPIIESVELKEMGDYRGADRILSDLCLADLRCLDAHAHLGNLEFDRGPDRAIRHYEVGVRIGELSLGTDFSGVLLWGYIDNRPFLRCLHGYGLCLWRLGRFEEAAEVFRRGLNFNPPDNLGQRFLLPAVRVRREWEDGQW